MSSKVAVVTGASSGLGKAVTELLVESGWTVFALARFSQEVSFNQNIHKVICNIRDLKDIDTAFVQIDQETDHIDLLVNCAGRALVKSFEDTTREEVMDVFGINLKGNIYIAHEVYKRMLAKKTGHIINVSSTSGLRAREQEVLYCASKWGLRGFTESLRLEARKHGIVVTGVYPGGMNSENFWKQLPDRDISGYMPPINVARQILHIIHQGSTLAVSEIVIERP